MEYIVHYFSFRHEFFVDHIKKIDQCCFNPQICKQWALVVILFSTLYSYRSGWSPHKGQLCVPFAHPWDLCGTNFAHIFLFCKPSRRIWWNCFPLNVQWVLDQFLWAFGGLWLPVYELLQLFTDSGPLTACHSFDHLQGFKVLTFCLNLVNHSESYVQDRAFLYTIWSVMFVNVAVSQGSDQTWCLLAALCQQRNLLLLFAVAKDEHLELEFYIH